MPITSETNEIICARRSIGGDIRGSFTNDVAALKLNSGLQNVSFLVQMRLWVYVSRNCSPEIDWIKWAVMTSSMLSMWIEEQVDWLPLAEAKVYNIAIRSRNCLSADMSSKITWKKYWTLSLARLKPIVHLNNRNLWAMHNKDDARAARWEVKKSESLHLI